MSSTDVLGEICAFGMAMMIGGVAVATTLRLKGIRFTVCEVDVFTPVAFDVTFGVDFFVELP
jgi:hypothetical protein